MVSLSSRERVRRTLDLQEPDRVPIDLGGRVSNIHRDAYAALAAAHDLSAENMAYDPFYSVLNPDMRLWERLGIDFQYLYLKGPEYCKRAAFADGSYENEWGIRVETVGIHSQRVTHPLSQATVADLATFRWPDPYRPDRVAGLHQQARRLYEETGYALVAAPVNGGLFEFGQHLRGMSSFLMDLISDKVFAAALLDRLLAVQKGLWEVFLREVGDYVEMVQLADDFGTQRSLLISPRVFREVFKPRYAELIRHIRRFTGAKVFLHCDGAIAPLIEDFIEIGVQVLNPLQPTAAGMDPVTIKARFGDRLAFHGAIDNQQLLPNGTPEEVTDAVRRVIGALAPGGGYILAAAHVIEPDIPIANVHAMFDAAAAYGVYPVRATASGDG